jgi:arsenate reductase-like glutaredoxin family protein
LNDLNLNNTFELQDLKITPLAPNQLKQLRKLTDSFEEMVNKRSRTYISEGWNKKTLSEADYEKLLLHHYSLLKRPFIVFEGKAYIGSADATLEQLQTALQT